jgi:hypothetical protein
MSTDSEADRGRAGSNPPVTKRLNYSQSMFRNEGDTKQGFLQKKGKMLAGWQQRWFEAAGHYLRYYKDDRKDSMLAAIDLRAVCIEKDSKIEKSAQFTIITPDSSKIQLRAGTPLMAMEWANFLIELQHRDGTELSAKESEGMQDLDANMDGLRVTGSKDADEKMEEKKPEPRPIRPSLEMAGIDDKPTETQRSVLDADNWNVKAIGGACAVYNSIAHNVQMCVVQLRDGNREWHVNNFNAGTISFTLTMAGAGYEVIEGDTESEFTDGRKKSRPSPRQEGAAEAKEAGDCAVASEDGTTGGDAGRKSMGSQGSSSKNIDSNTPSSRKRRSSNTNTGARRQDVAVLNVPAHGSKRVVACSKGFGSDSWDYQFAWEFVLKT